MGDYLLGGQVKMGCTLLSVGNLMVLIVASIIANKKVGSDISSTTSQNTEQKAISKLLLLKVTTTEAYPLGTDKRMLIGNHTEPSVYKADKITLLNKCNYTLASYIVPSHKNCSFDMSSSLSLRSVDNATSEINTYRDYKEYIYYRNIGKVIPYVANIPGMITNSLTILIAANIKPFHASEMYMLALGSADFITVLSRCIYLVWSKFSSPTSVSCKIPRYVAHIALIYSNMILMAWTIERFIAVIFPIKLASWCSIRNTKIILILLALLCLLLGTPYLTEFDLYSYSTGKAIINVCYATKFMTSVWTHMESIYYIYIPVVCVCVCNIAILCRLSAMAKARISLASNQETIDKKASENQKMTIVLLSISGSFLVLHIPYAIVMAFYYIYPNMNDFIVEDPQFFAKFLFYSSLFYFITEFQNTVNFFLYCVSGSKFRSTLKKLLCKKLMSTKGRKETQSNATGSTNY